MITGYRLVVTSSEDGGRNPQIEELYGLTKEDVSFYVAFLMEFLEEKNGNSKIKESGEGVDLVELDAVKKAFLASPPSTPTLLKRVSESVEKGYNPELLERLTGHCWSNLDGYYRAVENVRVYYIPYKVEDVTLDFLDLDEDDRPCCPS